jgi:hypothetical protein
MKTYKKEEIVQKIIDMRVKEFVPSRDIIDFLINTCGYKQSQAYNIYRDSQSKIAEHYQRTNLNALEETLNQYDSLLRLAKKNGNGREAREILKEMGKLKGLYIDRVEHSGSVEHQIQVIKLISPPDE